MEPGRERDIWSVSPDLAIRREREIVSPDLAIRREREIVSPNLVIRRERKEGEIMPLFGLDLGIWRDRGRMTYYERVDSCFRRNDTKL